MKNLLAFVFSNLFLFVFGQNTYICYENQPDPVSLGYSKSINDLKIIRVNFHFMQLSDGSGNFTEYTDGDGRIYSGYQYARDHIDLMNFKCLSNPQLNLPYPNSISALQKNYRFVLDGVYFDNNTTYYNYPNSSVYSAYGKDKENVINIFIQHGLDGTKGKVFDLTSNPTNKYAILNGYWNSYKIKMNTLGIPDSWAVSTTTLHELTHLLTLYHTVFTDGGYPCNNGCNITNYPCTDDGCTDTPTAIEVMQANNCTGSPSCNFNVSGQYCSNNLMDYLGEVALSPQQINRIHTALEGGLKQFLSCYAVGIDQTFCDIGYPKLSYFGKDIIVGNCGSLADITNQEKIEMYFSSSVELNNFEIRTDSEFEIILEPVCGF